MSKPISKRAVKVFTANDIEYAQGILDGIGSDATLFQGDKENAQEKFKYATNSSSDYFFEEPLPVEIPRTAARAKQYLEETNPQFKALDAKDAAARQDSKAAHSFWAPVVSAFATGGLGTRFDTNMGAFANRPTTALGATATWSLDTSKKPLADLAGINAARSYYTSLDPKNQIRLKLNTTYNAMIKEQGGTGGVVQLCDSLQAKYDSLRARETEIFQGAYQRAEVQNFLDLKKDLMNTAINLKTLFLADAGDTYRIL